MFNGTLNIPFFNDTVEMYEALQKRFQKTVKIYNAFL